MKSPSLKGGDSHGRIRLYYFFVVGDPARSWLGGFVYMVAEPEK